MNELLWRNSVSSSLSINKQYRVREVESHDKMYLKQTKQYIAVL